MPGAGPGGSRSGVRGDPRMFDRIVTNLFLLADCFTPFSIFDSPRFAAFHARAVARRAARPEQPLPEISAGRASRDEALRLYGRHPLVIRGALAQAASVQHWNDPQWWMQRYADESVLCTSPTDTGGFKLSEFFGSQRKLYVQGATALFEHRPELKNMVESEVTRRVAPGKAGAPPIFYQLFMGWKNQGSTVHCAIGLNVFRQISGRKRWYFFPPSQTPYVFPKLYDSGFSATSRTVQHHARGTGAPWFDKLERYSTVLEPGDVLIVPPWWWHCVENEAGDDDLVIGVATRYGSAKAALRADFFKSMISVIKARAMRKQHKDGELTSLQAALAFEAKLTGNRNETAQQLTLHSDQPAAVA